MRELFTIIILLVSLTLYSQDFLDKKVVDIDYTKDVEKLYGIGLNQTDIKFIGFLLVENLNKKIQIDSLTIKGFINKLNDYRLTDDYQMIKQIQNSKIGNNQDFADSLEILSDLDKAIEKSKLINKPVLAIFVGNMSLNSKDLKNVIISGTLKECLKNYVVTWLIVDCRDENCKRNLDYEINRFNTNISPYSVIIKGDKTIRYYEGFSKSMIKEYIEFLNKK